MAKYDIQIDQSASFNLPLIWKDSTGVPIDLTGTTAKMMIKRRLSGDPLATLTTDDGGGIIIDPLAGSIMLNLTPEQTKILIYVACIYDLFITDSNGFVKKLLEGTVSVDMAVTI